MTSARLSISTEPNANPADLEQLQNAIYDMNGALFPAETYLPVTLFLRDEHGTLRGGTSGGIWGGWFHLTFLWVDEMLRGQGYGTRLLEAAETEARSNGCQGAFLETHSFQARPFYERCGYSVVGEIPDYPPGHSFFFMRKFFDAG